MAQIITGCVSRPEVPVVLAHRSGDHRRLVLEFERCAETRLAASSTAHAHS